MVAVIFSITTKLTIDKFFWTIISARVKVYTEKALLLSFMDGSEFWIPRSTIHNDYNENEKEIFQDFLIDTWILKKREIDF